MAQTLERTKYMPSELTIDKSLQCPNCLSQGMSRFYHVANVPCHSCLLMPTRDAAINYPRGEIELGFCPACAFVGNVRFDASLHEYSTRYEETQGFSPTFNAFAKQLALDCINRYNVRNKTVLEIGCGKGEFLALMCELGPNKGIGIDPAYVPTRMNSSAAGRIEFIQDFYGPKYSHLGGDFICCRHTLEHIPDTYNFMKLIREAIGDKTESDVFFELPDATTTVFQPLGFWDVYYEHCTYFSAGSLARVFRATGFDPYQLERCYGEQYLLIGAKPVERASSPLLPLEDDLHDVRRQVVRFAEHVMRRRAQWRREVEEIIGRGEKVVIWGSGSKGVAFLTTLGITEDMIPYAVDINPFKHGKFMPGSGQEIVSPERLIEYRPDHVIVMNPIYCNEIRANLAKLGVSAELLPVEDASADI